MGTLQMTWQLKSLKRKLSLPPVGLKNLGNSCYLNSVLQCLTYTPPLANFCLKYLHSSNCDLGTAKEKKSDCPFCILEKRIARSLSIEGALDAPLKITNCVRTFAEHFRVGRQEDAHEFLRYVIDACHNTCLRLKKLHQQEQQRRKGGTENGGDNEGSEITVVKEIFGGALQSQIKCLSCGAESNKIDEIMDISLDVLHGGSLKEALQRFFRPEILDGNNKYKCDNCKKLVAARKQMSIFKAPNVLVVQLKRFEGIFGGKIDKPIGFEEVLVLSNYMCNGSQDLLPEYHLFGTIVHSGFSPDSGHYYAYIKDAMGRWYCCNDSYVSLSTLQEVLSEKVYILFFSRTNQRPWTGKMDLMRNGFKAHETNGSNTSIIQNSSGVGKPLSKRLVADHSEACRAAKTHDFNGNNTSIIQKSDGVHKLTGKKLVSDSPLETNGSAKHQISNGSNKSAPQKLGCSEKSVGVNKIPENQSEASDSIKSKVNKGNAGSGIKFNILDKSGTKNLPATGNIKIVVHKGASNGVISNGVESTRSVQGDQTVSSPTNTGGLNKMKFRNTVKDENFRPFTMLNGNGKIANGTYHSSEEGLCGSSGTTNKMTSGGSPNCKDFENGNTRCLSNDSVSKRKMQDDSPCVLLAKDAQSRENVEAFKELIGKEASLVLRSCGWSDEVYKFMHSRKKLCTQEDGSVKPNDSDKKKLLISKAKPVFIPKIPETLKATLIEHLRSFSQEQTSGS